MVMTAGDDPMTYEAYARDILFNGPLMNGGLPLGQGEPFYYQPFYPYFLAAAHFVFGEGMFGVLFLQRVLVALTAVCLTRIAMKLRGDAIWPMALLVSALFVWWKFAPIAADLLNESIYIPLLACLDGVADRAVPAAARCGRAASDRDPGGTHRDRAIDLGPRLGDRLAGDLLAAARPSRARTKVIGDRGRLFAGGLLAGRDAQLARQPPIRAGLDRVRRHARWAAICRRTGLLIDPAPRRGLYESLGIGGYTAQTIEYAIVAPGSFAANLGRKALFALGFYEPYAPGWGYSPVYIAVWLSAIVGLASRFAPPSCRAFRCCCRW